MNRTIAAVSVLSVVAALIYLVVAKQLAVSEASRLRQTYLNDFHQTTALTLDYQQFRRERGDWPPQGRFNDHSMLQFLDSDRVKGMRIDRYKPSTPGMILKVELRDDGTIAIWPVAGEAAQ